MHSLYSRTWGGERSTVASRAMRMARSSWWYNHMVTT